MMSSVIRPGDLVFVTGTSGLIGSHVADHLLDAGIHVRGAVRDADEAAMMKSIFRSRHPSASFEPHIVPDMKLPNAFSGALSGCTGIAHVASDLSFNPDPEVVITGCVNAIRGLLEAAKEAGTVRRVVYTSSSNAATDPEFDEPEKRVDASTWNDGVVEKAFAPLKSGTEAEKQEKGYLVYAASKYACEKAAWDWYETSEPGFVFNTILPNYTTGPFLQPLSISGAGSTARWVHDAFHYPNEKQYIEKIRDQPPQWQVDVRDVAKLHLAALCEEDVVGERLLGFAHPFGYGTFLEEFRKLDPHREFPKAEGDGEKMPSTRPEAGRSVELLKRWAGKMGREGEGEGWTGFAESVRASCLG